MSLIALTMALMRLIREGIDDRDRLGQPRAMLPEAFGVYGEIQPMMPQLLEPRIYVRVSTERRTLAQTIDQQVERLTAHVHAQGEALRAEDIFRDDGYRVVSL
jgi:hypothetical protein